MTPNTRYFALWLFVATAIQCAGQLPGTKRWDFDTQAIRYRPISSAAIGTDGTIYFGSEGTLYALNPDGTEKWRYAIGGDPFGHSSSGNPSLAVDGTIYIGLSGTRCAFSPAAELKWRLGAGSVATGVIQIVFTGELEIPHAVEASTDLIEWLPFATGTSANGTLRFLDSAGYSRRFYRARRQ